MYWTFHGLPRQKLAGHLHQSMFCYFTGFAAELPINRHLCFFVRTTAEFQKCLKLHKHFVGR